MVVMWIEYLYPFILIGFGMSAGILGVVLWLLYKEWWFMLCEVIVNGLDRLFYKFLDMILGEHEEY